MITVVLENRQKQIDPDFRQSILNTELDRKLEQSLTVAESIGVVGPRISIPTVDRLGPSHGLGTAAAI